MKLYAKVMSDRAMKSQGGNKYINIDLYVGDAKNPVPAGSIYFRIEENEYVVSYNDIELHRQEIKAKRQKGEINGDILTLPNGEKMRFM